MTPISRIVSSARPLLTASRGQVFEVIPNFKKQLFYIAKMHSKKKKVFPVFWQHNKKWIKHVELWCFRGHSLHLFPKLPPNKVCVYNSVCVCSAWIHYLQICLRWIKKKKIQGSFDQIHRDCDKALSYTCTTGHPACYRLQAPAAPEVADTVPLSLHSPW